MTNPNIVGSGVSADLMDNIDTSTLPAAEPVDPAILVEQQAEGSAAKE